MRFLLLFTCLFLMTTRSVLSKRKLSCYLADVEMENRLLSGMQVDQPCVIKKYV